MSPRSFKAVVLCIGVVFSGAHSYESVAAPPDKLDGLYELNFSFTQFNDLVLDAHITDQALNPALDGVVVFDYCSLKGVPRFDISQPDEAPISACADGSGKWIRLTRPVPVSNGHALLDFGLVQVVNVIGFRYSYSRGTVIANGSIDPVDWIR
jgi:hypothetical protein